MGFPAIKYYSEQPQLSFVKGGLFEAKKYTKSYRFGFNGQEKDDEVSGEGNSMTAEYWQYDGRLGRRWNVDVAGQFNSPYLTFGNDPISFADPNGAWTEKKVTKYDKDGKEVTSWWRKLLNWGVKEVKIEVILHDAKVYNSSSYKPENEQKVTELAIEAMKKDLMTSLNINNVEHRGVSFSLDFKIDGEIQIVNSLDDKSIITRGSASTSLIILADAALITAAAGDANGYVPILGSNMMVIDISASYMKTANNIINGKPPAEDPQKALMQDLFPERVGGVAASKKFGVLIGTVSHELGHQLGINHSNIYGDLMYGKPRAGATSLSGKSLRRLSRTTSNNLNYTDDLNVLKTRHKKLLK